MGGRMTFKNTTPMTNITKPVDLTLPVSGLLKKEKLPLALFLFSLFFWSIDYRPETGKDALVVQLPVLFVHALSFLAILRSANKKNLGTLSGFLFICFLFCIPAAIIGLLHGQEFRPIMANVIAFSVYISTTISCFLVLETVSDKETLFNKLKTVCFGFIVLHFITVYIARGGIDLSSSRYEYLSGATIPGSALLAIAVFSGFTIRDMAVALANVAVILISVTRTQLVVLAGQIASIGLASPILLFQKKFLKSAMAFSLITFSVITADVVMETGLTARWLLRLNVTKEKGADPTALSRIAENNYMVERFTDSIQTIMLGNGLSAKTTLIGREAMLSASLVGSATVHSNGFGHNNHLSLLYIGGLLFGMPLLVLTFINGARSFSLLRLLSKGANKAAQIGVWGALINIGTLASGFLSGTFSDRATCLWYGLGTGMLYWAKIEFAEQKKKREPLISERSPTP
jgi:hypothetical protein